ncbi:DNA polymerase III subunit chi [Alphaproteobacteria bacterium LSUCC0684]
MAAVAFYHLTRHGADEALPPLLAKTMAAEKRAVVCCDEARLGQFSTAIWSRQPESWLPHGVTGRDDEDAAICPIWLTGDISSNPNNATFFFLIDGRMPQLPDEAERVFILFDGHLDTAVAEARTQWKALGDAGHDLSYWQQEETGRWTQSA